MVSLKRAAAVMENALAYRLWQAPFLEAKFEPIRRHNDLSRVRRVLDVGCGPGSNCPIFVEQDYLGIDINPEYIAFARKRYGRAFEVADATQYRPDPGKPCDFLLLNSLLHHLDDQQVANMLRPLSQIVSPDGHLHVIDLVLPPERGLPRYFARNDRGDHPRSLAEWEKLLTRDFEKVVWEPFVLRYLGVALWQLLYFKGKPRA
jgi:SAM-dependent methyltransferase